MQNNRQEKPGNVTDAAAMARRARHPAERILSYFSIFLTIAVLVLLAWGITYMVRTPADESAVVEAFASWLDVEKDVAALLAKSGAWIILIVFLLAYFRYWLALNNEEERAASEDLGCADLISQEPQEIMDQYAAMLGMKKTPKLFFSDHGAPVTVYDIVAYGEECVVLSINYVNKKQIKDERMLEYRFRLATILGNIHMGYNNILFQVLTLPGRFIPGLRGLYLKSLLYSSDRMALEILANDPNVDITREDIAKALLLREFKGSSHAMIDVDRALENRKERFEEMSRFDKFLLRATSKEPLLMDRIQAVLDPTGKPGPLL